MPLIVKPPSTLIQLACHVSELALLKLGLPEDGVGVVEAVLDPATLLNVVQVDVTTRVGVSVGGSQDTSPSKLESILIRQFVLVLGVKHTVGECLTGTDTEEVARQTSAIAIDVVEGGTLLLGDTSAHGTHAEAHALVAVDEVGEDLAGGGNADAALVSELVQAALHAEPGEPVLAICGTTSQST